MSFPKYFATYCVMDGDTGANPFWHASILLSKQESQSTPVVVQDAYGFYSLDSTTTNPLIKTLKSLLGIKFDLQEGHGVLKQEKMRYLDAPGLHGISFETTQEHYLTLCALAKAKIETEKNAMAELDANLKANGLPANGYTRLIEEKRVAEIEGRRPRLAPFHVTMNLTSHGFDSSNSHSCKNYALNLLLESGVIDETLRDKIIGNKSTFAFPRFSSLPLPYLRLVSTGEPQAQLSEKTKAIYYKREWATNTLMWAMAPLSYQLLEQNAALAEEQNSKYYQISEVLTRIRSLENQLLKKLVKLKPEAPAVDLREQLNRVQNLYPQYAYRENDQTRLPEKISSTEKVLNIATISLNPEQINYSFMFRALSSTNFYLGLSGLLAVALGISFMLNPIGSAAVATTAGLYSANRLFGFFKEESQFRKMRADYIEFKTGTPGDTLAPTSELTVSAAGP